MLDVEKNEGERDKVGIKLRRNRNTEQTQIFYTSAEM